MTKSDFSFYKVASCEETINAYLDSYNNLYDKMRLLLTKRFLQRHLSLASMNVLEIGCGGGIWSVYFGDKVASLTCCDLRSHVVKAAKYYALQQLPLKHAQRLNWFTGDIHQHPSCGVYDFVFLKDVVEHVQDDLSLMQTIALHLKSGGFLYLSTQNCLSLNYLIEGMYNRLLGNKNWCGWDPTHLRFYNFRLLKALARKSGFRVVAWHGMYHIPYRFISRLICKRVIAHKALHVIENFFGEWWPFSKTGWAIGLLLNKE